MYQTLEYVSASPMVWFEVEVSEAIKESDRHKKRLMKKEINCLKNDWAINKISKNKTYSWRQHC